MYTHQYQPTIYCPKKHTWRETFLKESLPHKRREQRFSWRLRIGTWKRIEKESNKTAIMKCKRSISNCCDL